MFVAMHFVAKTVANVGIGDMDSYPAWNLGGGGQKTNKQTKIGTVTFA